MGAILPPPQGTVKPSGNALELFGRKRCRTFPRLRLDGARTCVRAALLEADYFDVVFGQAAPEAKAEGEVGSMTGFDLWIDLREPPTDLLPGMKAQVDAVAVR
jgi:hypothetical protein